MTTLVAFLFVLGVLVFVHELGHFLAARRLGIRVLTFSLGFGPKIAKITRGDTEYCISAIPLGGYVKMAGENPDDPRSGAPDEFLSKTKWQRFQVLIMGPVMNIVLAVVVLTIVNMQGVQVPAFLDDPPIVGVISSDSPAQQAGIVPGDRILTIAGKEIDTWEQAEREIAQKAGVELAMTVSRGGQPVVVNVTPKAEGRWEFGNIGILPDASPSVRQVVPGDPADRAGVKAGDVVYEVNGERVVFASQLSEAISKNAGREIDLTIRRDGEEQHIRVTPEQRGERGLIGITISEETEFTKHGPVAAFQKSVSDNAESSVLIVRSLKGLLTGETSLRQLQGPVGIAQLSGESAEAGWLSLFTFMAIISLNLGILNLMPVPVLDGGHILIMALEGIARRDFSMAVKEKMLLAGFVVLMMLMVTVIYNDLTRVSWIAQFMPWRN